MQNHVGRMIRIVSMRATHAHAQPYTCTYTKAEAHKHTPIYAFWEVIYRDYQVHKSNMSQPYDIVYIHNAWEP